MSKSPHQLIAEDALSELSVTRSVLQQMCALFESAKPHCAEHSLCRRLLDLGYFTCESMGSNAESAEERLEARLTELAAPQNADLANRGAEKEGDQ
ncbi:hypothetical protein PSCICO_46980 [Pseudomonas cichorii]|uniref:hypothetical protein n=1 Tax=Pseudomonas cichorii TaxID=36746 RepID=UPI00191017B4|nr:hypothetical protein [Pseudomonas cichorii]GFM89299.1 hypothetical protein PSCICO_46980 [Pseudomonas cichorii]